jgi:neuronal guanine nucleotide exchange factor
VIFAAEIDAEQVALQEAKYEIISSESSYYKSLLILQTVFVTSKELTDAAVLRNEDHSTLFSSAMKGW